MFLLSCNSNINSRVYCERKIDKYLNNIFKIDYPNYSNNELVRENAKESLKKLIDSVYDKGYFEDIPMKIFKIRKNPYGKNAIIQFYADNWSSEDNRLSSNLGFDIIGLVPESFASELSENNYTTYYIYGSNYKRADHNVTTSLVPMTYYSTEIEIEKTSYSVPKFIIGNFICEIDSLK